MTNELSATLLFWGFVVEILLLSLIVLIIVILKRYYQSKTSYLNKYKKFTSLNSYKENRDSEIDRIITDEDNKLFYRNLTPDEFIHESHKSIFQIIKEYNRRLLSKQ